MAKWRFENNSRKNKLPEIGDFWCHLSEFETKTYSVYLRIDDEQGKKLFENVAFEETKNLFFSVNITTGDIMTTRFVTSKDATNICILRVSSVDSDGTIVFSPKEGEGV